MKIQNKDTGVIINTAIVYRRGRKCVKFSGVTMAIDGNIFKKHWIIINHN